MNRFDPGSLYREKEEDEDQFGVTWRSGELSTLASLQNVVNQWDDQRRAPTLQMAAATGESAAQSSGAPPMAHVTSHFLQITPDSPRGQWRTSSSVSVTVRLT
jgi:hypothetical protein